MRVDRRQEHIEFREKAGEGRDPGEAHQQHGKSERQPRIGAREAGEIRNGLDHLCPAPHRQNTDENAGVGDDIDGEIDEHAFDAGLRARGDAHQRIAHV